MDRLIWAGRVYNAGGKNLSYVRYIDDFPARPLVNIWEDVVSSFMADKIYVVQTNVKVIERCLLMSPIRRSRPRPNLRIWYHGLRGRTMGRRWITVDTSRVALALARQRLMGAGTRGTCLPIGRGHAKEQSLTAQSLPRREFTE